MKSGVSIELENVARTFPDGTRGLKPTTLSIGHGETVVFLGPSGCGKTTCLRLIAGLERPDAGGRIVFDGEDVTRVEIERRNVGMVFQSYALFPNMTVEENVGYGLKVRKIAANERRQRVAEMLRLCGIEALAQRRIDQVSGGQRQRVALARAVAIRPRVLLLDEPLTALDAALRERLRSELNELLRALGITTIYVTHDQAEAMSLGDRIVVMRQREIVQTGTPREIYFTPRNRFVAEFIGAANILTGPIENGALVLAGGTLPIGDAEPMPNGTAMVRPESVRLVPAGEASCAGVVSSVTFLGDRQRVAITGAASSQIIAEVPGNVAIVAGETMGLVCDHGALRLLPEGDGA
jgi:putative spermidine/putrescine transport system ATP-binding protein